MQMQGIQQKIQQLEQETAQPERREAARARKKLTREVQRTLAEAGRSDADKIKYLENMFSEQVLWLCLIDVLTHCFSPYGKTILTTVCLQVTQQARLENQLIPLRRQCDIASKEREQGVQIAVNLSFVSQHLALYHRHPNALAYIVAVCHATKANLRLQLLMKRHASWS